MPDTDVPATFRGHVFDSSSEPSGECYAPCSIRPKNEDLTTSQPVDAEPSPLPHAADGRAFERLPERGLPDFPEVEVRGVAGETPRRLTFSVERGALRLPVIARDDRIIGVEGLGEHDLRIARTGALGRDRR